MRYDLDEKGAHLLRRHDVRPAFRVTVTRKIDRDDSVSLHEVGEYSMKGIDALRPRARKKNGRAIRATGSSNPDSQAIDNLRGDLSNIRKIIILHRYSPNGPISITLRASVRSDGGADPFLRCKEDSDRLLCSSLQTLRCQHSRKPHLRDDIPSHTAQNSIGASLADIVRRHGSGVLRN